MPIRKAEKHRYPTDWPLISAAIRFTRAEGRCECDGRCGKNHEGRCINKQGQPSYITGKRVVLTTAHLDHTPENCDDDNLMAMCQGCHLAYDKDHHAETRRQTREATN